jgi:CubicO group peptidase (beta-lactamase class C family)
VGIDAIVHTAIDKKAFPACQVVVAYRGDVLYSKAFGHHTYAKEAPAVRKDDLYDLASLTKVSATTLMAMHLHHKGILDLHKPIGRYLDLPDRSRMAGIPVSRLLTHQSGLRANFPIVSYVRSKKKTKVDCRSIYCDQEKDDFSIAITDKLFFSEKHRAILEDKIRHYDPRYGKRYRYSDLNFFLLQKILENLSGQSLDQWVDEHLRGELGLRNLTFRPNERFPLSRLVPTEKDKKWRKQLVHGYVHDEAASLFGGVSGHAGLFANAEDLAALFQLVLNEGTYGRSTLFGPPTARLFSEPYGNSHRGLGFDKPSFANTSSRSSRISEQGFGHTGFTGTCVWVDPEKELVFVFLSNRIHPDKKNRKLQELRIRKRIHDVVYQALGSLEEEEGYEKALVSQAVVE